jgi:hypothetical protein
MQSATQFPPSQATPSRINHRRARTLLALIFALAISLLAANHATAAVHAKSRSHKAASSHRTDVKSKSKKHSTKHSKKHSTKHSTKHTKKTGSRSTGTKKGTTSSTIKTTTPTSSANSTPTSSTIQTSAATTGTSPTPGSTSTGTMLFNGTALNTWWLNQSATPGRVQLVPDPDGAGNTVQQFTTYNTDVAPLTPTMNPRSQLVTPETLLKPGNTYWQSFEVYIPKSFTLVPGAGWVSLETGAFGYPYAGSPPLELSIENGDFRFQRNGFAPTPWQIAWATPVVKGQWYRFTWHFLFSATGWVELYVNDVQQKLKSGTTTYTQMPMSLIDKSDAKGPWISDEQLYYQLGMYQSTSVYFKNFKMASTQAVAES